ncbi:MAG TPA: BON domain-containing protein [Longimicrobiaceae bacterium]|nr:BON domain-containing protein [Longimicrobiaceae bacterium]
MTLARRSSACKSTRVAPVLLAVALLGGCGLLGGGRPAESPAQIATRTADDARIGREVEARLAAEPSVGAGHVRVDVQRGEVALHGAVTGFGALQCAIANAELVRGVRLVIDHLVLQPGPRTVRCLAPRNFAGG